MLELLANGCIVYYTYYIIFCINIYYVLSDPARTRRPFGCHSLYIGRAIAGSTPSHHRSMLQLARVPRRSISRTGDALCCTFYSMHKVDRHAD